MNRDQKAQNIAELTALFAGAEAILLADTSGVDVNSINQFRSACRAEGVTFRVVKNTLAKLALEANDMEALSASFVGPTAIALKAGDPVTPAKLAVAFAKDSKAFEIKGGLLAGRVLDAEGMLALSKMKNRDELRAELLSLFKAPQTQFVGIANTMVTQILGVMKARAEKLEEAA